MIKNYIIILFSTFCFVSTFAQEEEFTNDVHFQTIDFEYERPKVIFKLALLSQLDFNSPSLQFGLEFKIAK